MKKNIGLYSFIALCVCVVILYTYLFALQIIYPLKYNESILKISKNYGFEPSFVASVINAESGFNCDAISSKGAVGLMQIMPNTAEYLAQLMDIEYNDELLFDAIYNIEMGVFYLSYLQQKFEIKETVLCAYNAGEGVVAKWLQNKKYSLDGENLYKIPYKETKGYVEDVLSAKKMYDKRFANLADKSKKD